MAWFFTFQREPEATRNDAIECDGCGNVLGFNCGLTWVPFEFVYVDPNQRCCFCQGCYETGFYGTLAAIECCSCGDHIKFKDTQWNWLREAYCRGCYDPDNDHPPQDTMCDRCGKQAAINDVYYVGDDTRCCRQCLGCDNQEA